MTMTKAARQRRAEQSKNDPAPMRETNPRREERWHDIRSNDRNYGLVEGKTEYQYTVQIALKLAAWCKERKAQGLAMPFIEFYNQLGYIDQATVRILKYDVPPTFRYKPR